MIASTAIIYKNVRLGKNVIVEDHCVVGCPPSGKEDGELETFIGDGSHIRVGTIIYAGNTIGENFQTGNKANIRELNNIGNNVSVGTLSVVEHHVEIEDDVRIHTQVFIPEFTTLRRGAWLGPNVVCTNAMYPKSPGVKDNLVGPEIMEGAIIGANSTLLPGVKVGANSIVGAGSVVTKSVEEGVVVCGNPARKIKNKTQLPYGQGL